MFHGVYEKKDGKNFSFFFNFSAVVIEVVLSQMRCEIMQAKIKLKKKKQITVIKAKTEDAETEPFHGNWKSPVPKREGNKRCMHLCVSVCVCVEACLTVLLNAAETHAQLKVKEIYEIAHAISQTCTRVCDKSGKKPIKEI